MQIKMKMYPTNSAAQHVWRHVQEIFWKIDNQDNYELLNHLEKTYACNFVNDTNSSNFNVQFCCI